MTSKSNFMRSALGSGLGLALLLAWGCDGGRPGAPARPAQPPASFALAAAGAGSTCSPAGGHPKHAFTSCVTCHACQGAVEFDPTGPAVVVGQAAPTFDAATKTCSSVACHSVPAGTFSYYRQGGDGEAELVTVNYGGGPPKVTPSWYATGAGSCSACHDDPPRNNYWHSGYHGGQGPTGARNQCQLCHPDASSPNNGIGDTITNPTLHANGVPNVQASFSRACFGCH
jgi:predicted CxxxxCH...CXXCH cytochrome family protein